MTAVVSAPSDDVNQESGGLDLNSGGLWLGAGASPAASYAGLRFARLTIPPGSTIRTAWLMVYSVQDQWIGFSLTIAAHATGNSPTFSGSNLPSQRVLTSHRAAYGTDVNWQANTWYSLGEIAPVVQEVVSRGDWQSGNSLSLILRGMGSAWGRKLVMSFDGSPALAPRLVIRYRTSGGIPVTETITPTRP